MSRILIGIQARSGSTRLPKKAFELIGGQTMLGRVVAVCQKAARHLHGRGADKIDTVILTPKGDPIVPAFNRRCPVFEGSELDVLSRYQNAAEHYQSDIVVRITGDCPLLPGFVLSRMIDLSLQHAYDYVSNVDERFRTTLDGADCEVISRALLEAAHEHATDPLDREHVTTWMRREPPEWARVGVVCNHFDLSHVKLSVDTKEDLERVRHAFDSANDKYRRAIMTFGQQSVHLI